MYKCRRPHKFPLTRIKVSSKNCGSGDEGGAVLLEEKRNNNAANTIKQIKRDLKQLNIFIVMNILAGLAFAEKSKTFSLIKLYIYKMCKNVIIAIGGKLRLTLLQ